MKNGTRGYGDFARRLALILLTSFRCDLGDCTYWSGESHFPFLLIFLYLGVLKIEPGISHYGKYKKISQLFTNIHTGNFIIHDSMR